MKKKRAQLHIRPRPSDAQGTKAELGHLDPDCHHWDGVLVDATRCRDNYGNLAMDRNIEDAPTSLWCEYRISIFYYMPRQHMGDTNGSWWVNTLTQRGGEREKQFWSLTEAVEYARGWASRNYWVDETLWAFDHLLSPSQRTYDIVTNI